MPSPDTHFGHRESAGIVVDLFWSHGDPGDRFRVEVQDTREAHRFVLHPATGPEAILDAFHHPFVLARSQNPPAEASPLAPRRGPGPPPHLSSRRHCVASSTDQHPGQDPRLNLTQTYLFDGETVMVPVMVVNTSLAGERIPGFHPEGRYEFKVHLDNEEYENLAYRFVFGGSDGDAVQGVALYQLTGADARDDGARGTLIACAGTGEVINGPGGSGVRAWACAAADPFYLDLRQLAGIIEGLDKNKPIEFGEWDGKSSIQQPHRPAGLRHCPRGPRDRCAAAPGTATSAWAPRSWPPTRERPRQVNRAAIPMMWPLFLAIGDADDSSDYARDTASHPGRRSRQRPGAHLRHDRRLGTDHRNRNPQAMGRAVTNGCCRYLLPHGGNACRNRASPDSTGRTLADNAPEAMYGW